MVLEQGNDRVISERRNEAVPEVHFREDPERGSGENGGGVRKEEARLAEGESRIKANIVQEERGAEHMSIKLSMLNNYAHERKQS